MSAIEWVATAFGVACVILTIRQSVWCWPTGLVQVFLYIFVFAQARLYSDVILHVIYVLLGIYGWWKWTHGAGERGTLPVARTGAAVAFMWTAVGVAATILIGAAMRGFTNADRPFWDAAVLALSLIAQWLMARKVLESWLFWIAVDVLAIGLYAAKALYPTAGLYTVFLVLAITGFFEWKRSMTTRRDAAGQFRPA
jgi:nicotinamide mononucleotide transporter